ncbi:DPCD protein family-domain-containing protein [Cladochytrium replicatum]|nr:DPCD protein family-domain-containing protein [Cladochytrium replicatum]
MLSSNSNNKTNTQKPGQSTQHVPQLPVRTSSIADGRKKVHSRFPDESEMIEEFDLRSDELLVRKVRRKTLVGSMSDWAYEIGEPPFSRGTGMEESALRPSSSMPTIVRQDTRTHFQWRIRNLPYPKSNYALSVDDDKGCVVVRTLNKKYFTKISISDMDRLGMRLDAGALSFDWGANTLLVWYRKPDAILEKEHQERRERQQISPTDSGRAPKEGDVECAQS